MLPDWPPDDLPRLIELDNCFVTSRPTEQYNCIAWAAGENHRRWDIKAGYYWPAGVPRQRTMSVVIQVYRTVGYTPCANGDLEDGIEKVAIYGEKDNGKIRPTHAALQLSCGHWTSKLGDFTDVVHKTPEDVNGRSYGEVIGYMARPRTTPMASSPR
jgi:hypothetical protein